MFITGISFTLNKKSAKENYGWMPFAPDLDEEPTKEENEMSENQRTTRFPTPAEIEEKRKERIAPLLEEAQHIVQRHLESDNPFTALMIDVKYHPAMTALKEALAGSGWSCTYSVESVPDQRGEELRKEIRLEVSPSE